MPLPSDQRPAKADARLGDLAAFLPDFFALFLIERHQEIVEVAEGAATSGFAAGPPQGEMRPLGGQRGTRSGKRGGSIISGINSGLVVREAAGLSRSEGIQPGDVIIAVNDVRLDSVDDFARALSRFGPGASLALLVMRDMHAAYVSVQVPTAMTRPPGF